MSIGRPLRRSKVRGEKFAFWYAKDFTLTSGQTQQSSITISADADFYATKTICVSEGTFTCKIQNSGSGRDHQNIAIDGSAMFGKGWEKEATSNLAMSNDGPFELEIPAKFNKNSDIGITVTDTSSSSNTVQLIFFGYKLYKRG